MKEQKGNYSNGGIDTFNSENSYIGIRLQQGVPLLDRDWNELEDIRRYQEKILREHYIGNGVPDEDSFKIELVGSPSNDLKIKKGRCLVNGLEAVNIPPDNNDSIHYTDQDNVAELTDLAEGVQTRTDLVYLDVWVEEITDPEVLGNNQDVDMITSVRHKIDWRVSFVEDINLDENNQPTTLDSIPKEDYHYYYPLATIHIRKNPRPTPASLKYFRSITDLRKTKLSLQYNVGNQQESDGTISSSRNIENKTTTDSRQLNVSENSTTLQKLTQINACSESTASGTRSQVNASHDSTASYSCSQVNTSHSSEATNLNSQVNSSIQSIAEGKRSQVNASEKSLASGKRSQVNASCHRTGANNTILKSIAEGENSQVNACVASIAHAEQTQVNASENSEAIGLRSQVNASCHRVGLNDKIFKSIAKGINSQVNASVASLAGGAQSQINASYSSYAYGTRSQVNASISSIAGKKHSQVNVSDNSIASGEKSQVNASKFLQIEYKVKDTEEERDEYKKKILQPIASGENSQINACVASTASGAQSQVNASRPIFIQLKEGEEGNGEPIILQSIAEGDNSQVNASLGSAASGAQSQINASLNSIANASVLGTVKVVDKEYYEDIKLLLGLSQVNASFGSDATGVLSQVNASLNSKAVGFKEVDKDELKDGAVKFKMSQVNASEDSTASGEKSQVNASTTSTASGLRSQINASSSSNASGNYSQVNASRGSDASGVMSQVNASISSEVTNQCTEIHASQNVQSRSINDRNDNFKVCGGYGDLIDGKPTGKNINWELDSTEGNFWCRGTISSGLQDFGEYFENMSDKKEIQPGKLVTLEKGKIRAAKKSEDFIGVFSRTAEIRLGNNLRHWNKKVLTGDFGEPIYENKKDENWICGEGQKEKDRPSIRVLKLNPKYDPNLPFTPRSERANEWTLVGMIGQVYVRCDKTVEEGDFVTCKGNGIGTKARPKVKTKLLAMKITTEFNGKYKVAYCCLNSNLTC